MMGLWIDQEAIRQAMMAKRLILSLPATYDLLLTMAPPTATLIGLCDWWDVFLFKPRILSAKWTPASFDSFRDPSCAFMSVKTG